MRQDIIVATEQKLSEMSGDTEKEVQKEVKDVIKERQQKDSDNKQLAKMKDRAQANRSNLLIFGIPEANGQILYGYRKTNHDSYEWTFANYSK